VASAGYNFVRWLGGATAPYAASKLGELVDPSLPYYAGALCCLVGVTQLVTQASPAASSRASWAASSSGVPTNAGPQPGGRRATTIATASLALAAGPTV
jgi:hypothetical protein